MLKGVQVFTEVHTENDLLLIWDYLKTRHVLGYTWLIPGYYGKTNCQLPSRIVAQYPHLYEPWIINNRSEE
jgi:hypothetical protein